MTPRQRTAMIALSIIPEFEAAINGERERAIKIIEEKVTDPELSRQIISAIRTGLLGEE